MHLRAVFNGNRATASSRTLHRRERGSHISARSDTAREPRDTRIRNHAAQGRPRYGLGEQRHRLQSCLCDYHVEQRRARDRLLSIRQRGRNARQSSGPDGARLSRHRALISER
jgi:hypothetical protein